MALITCPECGKQVSTLAEKCTNCGYPVSKMNITVDNPAMDISTMEPVNNQTIATEQPKKKHTGLIAVIILALVICIGGAIFAVTNKLTDSESQQVQQVYNEIASIGAVTLDSGDKINKVENSYNQLSPKCQRHVKNRKELANARNTFDSLKAENVVNTINGIGSVKLMSASKISKARKSYDELTQEQKDRVSNYNSLTAAEETLNKLQIEDCESKITEIGTVSIESLALIKTANEAYDKLSDAQKSEVSNYNKLQAAVDNYNEISVKNCIYLIDSIGEVTLDSEKAIKSAEAAYNALLEKNAVTNHTILTDARKVLDQLKAEKAEREKTLNPGDVVKNSKWEATFKRVKLTARLLPNNTSGWYMYYSAQDDQTFVDMVFTLKNIDVDVLKIQNAVSSVSVLYDNKYTYTNYRLYTSVGDDIDPVYDWDGLSALDSVTLHIAVSIPREAQSNNAPVKVKLNMLGQEKIINAK